MKIFLISTLIVLFNDKLTQAPMHKILGILEYKWPK